MSNDREVFSRPMIDLHTHSTASDGSYTPEKLIELALERGLRALALTDHDTLDGLERARARAQGTQLRFIGGIEIEIDCESGEFHLLGLGIDGDRKALASALSRVQEARRLRNDSMVEKMQSGGIPITREELAQMAGGEIVSRAHFAQLLARKKISSSIDAAFKKLIGKGMPYYQPRMHLDLGEATAAIRSAGGIAVIAHPVSLGLRGPALRAFISSCRDRGVRGIECWHPNHSLKETRLFSRLAHELGLVETGGSDFHGPHIPSRMLGISTAGREIADALLDALPRAGEKPGGAGGTAP
jgi:3',5'-nucleoside bisphosphate phosphatase